MGICESELYVTGGKADPDLQTKTRETQRKKAKKEGFASDAQRRYQMHLHKGIKQR